MNVTKKLAVITTKNHSGEKGGAERFFDNLVKSLENHRNILVDRIDVLTDESTFEGVLEAYLSCYDLDLSGYDGVISTKVPTYAIRHPNHVCYLVHTIRVFYDMFEKEFPKPSKQLLEDRKLIQLIDTLTLSKDRTKKIFTIGNEVSKRLKYYNNLSSEVLHPGLGVTGFYTNEYNFIFMPGRLHRWKRVDLVIKAMKYVKAQVKLKIAGTGEDEAYLKELAHGDSRIEFLGFVSDQELLDLYANSLIVPFVAKNEDYGYITLEAFKSKKPVLTCIDSGEPTFFVKHGITGFVTEPKPKEIAKSIDLVANNKGKVIKLGENGYNSIKDISWDKVAEKLLSALGVG